MGGGGYVAFSPFIHNAAGDDALLPSLSQLPSQMAAVLESSLLRHVFAIWSDPSAALRVTYWLQYTLGYGTDINTDIHCTYM